jgi:hypothetical protein
MKEDTEGAVVGIGVDWMHVRHLDYGKQRQQDKTHESNDRQSMRLCAAFPAGMCLKCCQTTTSTFKDTQNRMRGAGRGYARRFNLDLW